MRAPASALLFLLATLPLQAAGPSSWHTIRLEGTSLRVAWPSGKRASFVGTRGKYRFSEKDEGGRKLEYAYMVHVEDFDPDANWDAILNRESTGEGGHLIINRTREATILPSGGDEGTALIVGTPTQGRQAGFPVRRWTLAHRESDGTLQPFGECFVLRAPAHYVAVHYEYTPHTAREGGLDVFERIVASVQAFDKASPAPRPRRKKKTASPKP